MGRSSKVEAARTRERILNTACALFRQSGVDQISVADIMGAAGLTTGGFYKHFASKEALIAEAVALAFDEAAGIWDGIAAGDLPGGRRQGLIDDYLRSDADSRCPMIAFAPHTTGADVGQQSLYTYRHGVEALLSRFSATTAGSETEEERSRTLLLFAAMVGARVLGEATGDASWTDRLRETVLKAAAEDLGSATDAAPASG